MLKVRSALLRTSNACTGVGPVARGVGLCAVAVCTRALAIVMTSAALSERAHGRGNIVPLVCVEARDPRCVELIGPPVLL